MMTEILILNTNCHFVLLMLHLKIWQTCSLLCMYKDYPWRELNLGGSIKIFIKDQQKILRVNSFKDPYRSFKVPKGQWHQARCEHRAEHAGIHGNLEGSNHQALSQRYLIHTAIIFNQHCRIKTPSLHDKQKVVWVKVNSCCMYSILK